jgi:hypothetical protein
MRDLGFDFYWYDKFCDNLFARQFEADVTGGVHYEVLTAFEVFEHLQEPRRELGLMLDVADNILFSTWLLPAHNPVPGDWWYYFPLHGQHIAFYTTQALQVLAELHHVHLTSDGASVHLLTKKPLRKLPLFDRFRLRLTGGVRFLRRRMHRDSWLGEDFTKLSGGCRF